MEGKKGQEDCSIGMILRIRLQQLGITHFFSVPGDFTMPLLDELIDKGNGLKIVSCCNELNAGYAADGFCRNGGICGVLVVTYLVGALSAINAVAGAYAENLPILVVAGAPNVMDELEHKNPHHTLGDKDLSHCSRIFESVTSHCYKIHNLREGQGVVDSAITTCMASSKPVYLEIPCNLTGEKACTLPMPQPMKSYIGLKTKKSDETSLSMAVDTVFNRLTAAITDQQGEGDNDRKSKIVLIVGANIKPTCNEENLYGLVDVLHLACGDGNSACECAVVTLPDAKGLFDETHPFYKGCYWGNVSTPGTQDLVENESDIKVFIGPYFNDYNTVGWTVNYRDDKSIILQVDHVHLLRQRFSNVKLSDVLCGLAKKFHSKAEEMKKGGGGEKESSGKGASAEGEMKEQSSFKQGQQVPLYRDQVMIHVPNDMAGNTPLNTQLLLAGLQCTLDTQCYGHLITETGDSWFITQKLLLSSPHQRYYIQMQYGSIGWTLAVCLGIGIQAAKQDGNKKLLAVIGDGSFQVSAQELSSLIRNKINITIVLINNGVYTIEEQIHDGPYNELVVWDYVGLLYSMRGGEETAVAMRVHTVEEMQRALKLAEEHQEGVSLIECCLDKSDCTEELKCWGKQVGCSTKRLD